MKLLAPLTAAAVLAASLAAPVFAHSGDGVHVHLQQDRVLYPGSRYVNQKYEIDPSILYPIPKPRIPIPVPGPCLSCPTFDMNPGQLVNPVLR